MGAAQYRAPEYLTRSELPNNVNCEVTVLVTPGSRIRRARFVAPRQSLKQVKRAPRFTKPTNKVFMQSSAFFQTENWINHSIIKGPKLNRTNMQSLRRDGFSLKLNRVTIPKYACTRKSITTVKLSEMPSSQILHSSSNLSSQLSSLFSIAYSLTAHPFLYLRQPCSVTPETSIHLTFLFGQSDKDDAVMLTSSDFDSDAQDIPGEI